MISKQKYFKVTHLLLLILLLVVSLTLTACTDDSATDSSDHRAVSYKPKQVKMYSNATLSQMYQAFPSKTKMSVKYQKTKDNSYRNQLLEVALKQGDLDTIVAICHYNPTNLNKAYVYACGWNVEYDRANVENYAVCLIYYYDLMPAKGKKQIPPLLYKVIKACENDPKGKSINVTYSNDDHEQNNDDDEQKALLWQQMMNQWMMTKR